MEQLAGILTASASAIAAAALLVIAIRGFRRLEAKVGNVHVVAEQVNRSVNNVAAGEPTLREVVLDHQIMLREVGRRLDEHISESNQRFDRIEDHITKPKPVATKQRKAS